MKTRIVVGVLAALVLLVLPWTVSTGFQHALVHAIVFAVFAASFNLASGSGGMLSFGHALPRARCVRHAARDARRRIRRFRLPHRAFAAGRRGDGAAGRTGDRLLCDAALGRLLLHAHAGVRQLFHQVAPNLATLFGGETGISTMRMPSLGIPFANDLQVYYLVLAWGLLCLGLLWLYMQTPFGRLTLGVRENEQRLKFLGFDVHATKVIIFSLSAAIAGVAGGMLAVSNKSANYELFSITYSANVLLYTFIGGAGLFLGAPLGAAILTLAAFAASNKTQLWLLYQGLLSVLLMMYAPGGVARNIELYREGRLRALAGPYLYALLPAVCLTGAVVFRCEALAVIQSREYAAKRLAAASSPGGAPALAEFLGTRWDPAALGTWALPLGLLVVGLVTRRGPHAGSFRRQARMTELALELADVRKRFGSSEIIRGLNLRVRTGEIHAVIGPNGAGKSTLFNLVSGMFPPDSGAILMNGQSIRDLPPHQIARKGLARSFQITNVFPRLSVFENIRIACMRRHGLYFSLLRRAARLHDVNREAEAWVARVHLEPVIHKPAGLLTLRNSGRSRSP